ncbi:MAG: thiamine pyrophosphate-binding protein [Chloroflexota bacterium]
MPEIYGAQAIIKCLEQYGIEMVFGIPGLYNMPIFDALYHHPTIRVVVVRHEGGAAFMADGYARATGRPAAVLTLPGPGLTNALTGIGEAFSDSVPMLVLSTQVNRQFIDQNAGLLHEMTGQFEMLSKLTKYSERITEGSQIAAAFQRAMQAMRSGRPRPVQIEIPRDIQVGPAPWPQPIPGGLPAAGEQPARCRPSEEMLRSAAFALAQAQRPLIYAGGGVISSEAGAELLALAERLGAPVLTTGMGAGAIPSDHPLACGVAWIAAADIRPLVAACDAFLAVGTRFNQGMTAGWELPLPETTIRVDIDEAEIERNLPMRTRLVGDARFTLDTLDRLLAEMGVQRYGQVDIGMQLAVEQFRQALQDKLGSSAPWMAALRAALPRDAIISCDMSLFWADMLGTFPIYHPRTMLFPWGFGTLGFAIPEAIGAKLANPNQPVAAICGDGAFLFTGAELATAVQYNLGLPILVPNNHAYGMIKVQQRDQYDEKFIAVDLVNPDFVQLAQAFGANGVRVAKPGELAEAIRRALKSNKPTVIEIPWRWVWGNEA